MRLVLTAALISVIGAYAEASWKISSFSPSALYNFTPGTGAAVEIGPTPIYVGIDFVGDGRLVGVGTGGGLDAIDPSTGTATRIGSTGLTGVFEGDLAYDAVRDVLWLARSRQTPDTPQLFRVDLQSGLADLVGDVATDDLSGLAVDAAGSLWGIASNGNLPGVDPQLLRLDPADGSVLSARELGVPTGAVVGADISDSTGELFMATDLGDFFRIDTGTGLASFVDTTGVARAAGLAYVPAPMSLSCLTVALALATRRRSSPACGA